VYVAVPTMIVLGLGFLLLPLTTGPTSVGLVAALMGLGNGISSGIVLTLGADAAPPGSCPVSQRVEGLQRRRQRRRSTW
jgi:hypothetical protein